MKYFNKPAGKRKVLIITAVVLVVVVAVGAAYTVMSGYGKSAKKVYLEAESKNFKKYSAQIKSTIANLRENAGVYNKKAYKRHNELIAGIESGNKNPFGLKNAQDVFDVIAKCKLVSDTLRDPSDKKSVSTLSLLFDRSPFIDAKLFSDKSNLMFTIPTLLPDRYFGLEKNNIDKVYDRFGVPVRPTRVISSNDIVDTINFDNKAFDKSMSAYGALISGMITENNVKFGRNITLDVSGQKAECRELTVTLDAAQTKQLIQGLAHKMASDDTFISMIYGNAAGISGLIREAGFFSLLDFFEKSKLVVFNDTEKKMIKGANIAGNAEEFKNKLITIADGYEFTGGLHMKLAIDKSGNILDRRINLLAKRQDSGSGISMGIHTGSSSIQYANFRNFLIDVDILKAEISTTGTKGDPSVKSTGDGLKLSLASALKPGKEKGDISGSIKTGFVENTAGKLKSSMDANINIDSALDKLTLKRHTKITYDIALDGANQADKGKLGCEINTASWSNKKLNTRNSSTAIVLNLKMPSFDAGDFKLKLNLAREDKFGIEPFMLPTPAKSSIVYLDRATDSELNKVSDDMLASFGTFYMTNKPVFDAVLGTK